MSPRLYTTLITAPEENIIRNLRIIASARQADPFLAQMIPFVHVEGPHIAPEDGPRGAPPIEHVRAPDIAEFFRWQAASNDLVGMVTLFRWDKGSSELAVESVIVQGKRWQ